MDRRGKGTKRTRSTSSSSRSSGSGTASPPRQIKNLSSTADTGTVKNLDKMIVLTGNNLSSRQQELNTIVNEAARNEVNFNEVQNTPESSDIDKLFKIDLASKYKNVDYIVEILKSGDSLYISRALKCRWLYDDEYSHIMNSKYLDTNIFPFMSMKMKRKMMTTILKYVSANEERSADFYFYCLNKKIKGLQDKFLFCTSESFKLNHMNNVVNKNTFYLKKYIGESFTLFDKYMSLIVEPNRKQEAILDFYYLCQVCNEKYLKILENCFLNLEYIYPVKKFALRTSEHIMRKHKQRVLEMPFMYIHFLNNKVLTKYSSSDDAKIYAISLLPNESEKFWSLGYYSKYKYILELIPFSERYTFLKSIFMNKYPKAEFEMTKYFYHGQYYEMMTAAEKEEWALRHIHSKIQLHGHGRDYIWYGFINFDKAFIELKKYILITQDLDTRSEIVKILLKAAKTQKELEKTFNYYYERHVNEVQKNTESFLNLALNLHNIYEFDENCWAAFDKIMLSIEVYNTDVTYNYKFNNFRTVSLVYHILHNKEFPDILKTFTRSFLSLYDVKLIKTSDENHEIVYKYLLKFFVDLVKSNAGKPYEDDVRKEIIYLVSRVLRLLNVYEKTLEECPDIIREYINLDFEEFKNDQLLRHLIEVKKPLTAVRLLHFLKKDVTLFMEQLPELESAISYNNYDRFNINEILRKLRVYFSHDSAKDYLKFCMNLISDKEASKSQIFAAALGVFLTGDENSKLAFVEKYTPVDPKIDYRNMNRTYLYIQESVCRFAYYSRPTVPLSNMLKYVKGDYLKYCLPMFNFYMAHLKVTNCMEFIEELLKRPVSVQKHGIRLAFKYFNAEKITNMILKIWNKSKNVSLKKVIYLDLYDRVSKEGNKTIQRTLFDHLKTFTLDVNEEDDSDVINAMLKVKLPKHLIPEYVEVVWKSVDKLPDLPVFIENRTEAINNIANLAITEVNKETILPLIINHVELPNMPFISYDQDVDHELKRIAMKRLNNSKWFLVKKYIVSFDDEENLKSNLKLLSLILVKCLEMWDKVDNTVYTIRKFLVEFVKDLQSYDCRDNFRLDIDPIFESILKQLQDKLPVTQIYMLIWELRLALIVRKVIRKRNSERYETFNAYKIIEDLIACFTDEIIVLIKEFKKKDMYYTSFISEIVEKLKMYVNMINDRTFSKRTFYDSKRVHEHFAKCLLNYDLTEAHILTVHIMSTHGNGSEVLQKLNKVENEEVKCLFYNKFVMEDFKYRNCSF